MNWVTWVRWVWFSPDPDRFLGSIHIGLTELVELEQLMYNLTRNDFNRRQFFSWKLAHNRLLTKDKCYSKRITTDNFCPRCLDFPMTIIHMLRDYEEVRKFWLGLIELND